MYDMIDATAEPINFENSKSHFVFKSQNMDLLGENGPTFVSLSTTDSENNADFILDTNEADHLPLIRGPAQQGIIHRLLRQLRRPKFRPVVSLQQSEDEDIGGDGCQKSLERDESPIQFEAKENRLSNSRLSLVGILLASISCIFFATSSFIVKVSAIHPMELLCVRGLVQAALVSPIVIASGSSFLGPPGSRGLLVARATLGSVGLIMAFNSIHLIPLADASTVIFTSPVFVSLFACMCLGELITWFDASMISLTVLGVVLVSKPTFDFVGGHDPSGQVTTWIHIVGIFCGVCAAMMTALSFIVLRQLKQVHYSVTVFWFSSVMACFGSVLTVALDGMTLPCTWVTAMQCLGIGVCGFLGQILLTKALQLENAGPVAVTRSLDIVLSFVYQIIFLQDTSDLYSYIGSALVVLCVVLTGLRRWLEEMQVNHHVNICSGHGGCGCGCTDDSVP